jgi:hypothetical protein
MSLLPTKPDTDTETTLTRGAFVGDVDKLISQDDAAHTTTLVCNSHGTVFHVSKQDLQGFLLENPGILMGLSGRLFVR